MISHACPIIVLDDERSELWQVTHGLGYCGLPVMPHLVVNGTLQRVPEEPYSGIRFIFTDLHILGPSLTRPEQYISALIGFLNKLILPSTYLLVFWSNYAHEADEAWALLTARIPKELMPFGYAILSKEFAKAAADEDPDISEKAGKEVKASIEAIIQKFPQLQAIMEWESGVSRSAAETTNDLIKTLARGNISFEDHGSVMKVFCRMAQEALGYPHAPAMPTKGLTEALLPIAQEWLENSFKNSYIDKFLNIKDAEKIDLPSGNLIPLLNDFFIHSEKNGIKVLDRGAIIKLANDYITNKSGLVNDLLYPSSENEWSDAIGAEFVLSWNRKNTEERNIIKNIISCENVFAIELSADCDHAQNKPRTQRFLLAYFVENKNMKYFYSSSKSLSANESIYTTPDITLLGKSGRLFISCRSFMTKAHGVSIDGIAISKFRKDSLAEISHLYSTHMRRPGKIAFF